MDTNNLMERIQRELGYSIPIQTEPQQPTPVKSENQETDPKTDQKQIDKPWLFKPGQTGNPKGRPKKPKDFLESLDEEFETIRTLNPDGTAGKNAAQVLAKAAMDKAIVEKNLEAMKWIVERKYGKVPNINQNTNVNADFQSIMDEIKGRKKVIEVEPE